MVTYFDLKKGYILKKDDELLIHGIKHLVKQGVGFYLRNDELLNNAKIFDLLGLSCEEKNDWAKKFGGLNAGKWPISFPEMPTLEALTKFVIDIYEHTPYKVGDKVKILECKGNECDYPAGFNSGMQKQSGKTFIINGCKLCTHESIAIKPKYNGDPHWYTFEGDIFTWSSAHFTRVTEKSVESEENMKKEDLDIKLDDSATSATTERKEPEIIPPKYKPGDKVRIKPRIGNPYDYPAYYIDEMLQYAGKICTIDNLCSDAYREQADRKYFDGDISCYRLKEAPWAWSSSMLEPASCDKAKKEVDHEHIRYQDLKDGYILENGDRLLIKGLLYHVQSYDGKRWWLSNGKSNENEIFNKLGIDNIKSFARKYGDCYIGGLYPFPEMSSTEELTKLVLALYEYKPDSTPYVKSLNDTEERLTRKFPFDSGSECKTEDTGIRLPKRSGNLNIQL